MGLAIVLLAMLLVELIIIGISLISALVFFIISAVRKKKGKNYKVFRIISLVCLAPTIFVIVFGIIKNSVYENTTHNSVAYQVLSGNYETACELIEKGASPNCGLYGNEEAKDGEATFFYSLCVENYMYPDGLKDLMNEDDRFEMIEFMLENGADINKVTYSHESDYEEHFYEGASWRTRSDFCGSTPLMYAIRNDEYETAKFLIEKGADVNIKDYCGFNAAAIAASETNRKNTERFLELLKENGCEIDEMTNFNFSTNDILERRFEKD